jgi:hypothetical protein
MPAHYHEDRLPLLVEDEAKEPASREPKPIGPRAVAAAVRWHGMTLAELMRESDAMVRAMTGE